MQKLFFLTSQSWVIWAMCPPFRFKDRMSQYSRCGFFQWQSAVISPETLCFWKKTKNKPSLVVCVRCVSNRRGSAKKRVTAGEGEEGMSVKKMEIAKKKKEERGERVKNESDKQTNCSLWWPGFFVTVARFQQLCGPAQICKGLSSLFFLKLSNYLWIIQTLDNVVEGDWFEYFYFTPTLNFVVKTVVL